MRGFRYRQNDQLGGGVNAVRAPGPARTAFTPDSRPGELQFKVRLPVDMSSRGEGASLAADHSGNPSAKGQLSEAPDATKPADSGQIDREARS
jgi:hypothetical protein